MANIKFTYIRTITTSGDIHDTPQSFTEDDTAIVLSEKVLESRDLDRDISITQELIELTISTDNPEWYG